MGARGSGVGVRGLLLAAALALVVALTAWLTAARIRSGAYESPAGPPGRVKSSEVRLLLVGDVPRSAGEPEPLGRHSTAIPGAPELPVVAFLGVSAPRARPQRGDQRSELMRRDGTIRQIPSVYRV